MRRPLMWFAFGGIACLFILYKALLFYSPPPDYAGFVTVSGRVYKKDLKNDGLVLYLKNTSVETDSSGNSARQSKGFICYIQNTDRDIRAYPLGSFVMLKGKAGRISHATNPGEFDASAYYGARGYYYTLRDGEVLSVRGGWKLFEGLYRIRLYFADVFESLYGEKYGGILSAMLLGEKNSLKEEDKELYSLAGISHILAISGLHISLIGAFVYTLLTCFPVKPKTAFILTVTFLILYGFTVGFAPSVFRALFMFAYRMSAKQFKKSYDPPTALGLSAFLTCLFYPGMLLDSSFVLTYLAVAGILMVYPCFRPVIYRGKKPADGLLAGIGIFAATLPAVVYFYNRISFAGLLLNIFILPAMPVVFVCGFLSLFFSLFRMRAALIFATVGKSILYTFEWLSNQVLKIPGTVMYVKTPGAVRCIFYAVFLVFLSMAALMIKRRLKIRYYSLINERAVKGGGKEYTQKMNALFKSSVVYRVAFGLGLAALFLFLILTPERFTLTFLDVGQGDGIFLRTDSGDVFMIDGGSGSKTNIGKNILAPALHAEGENTVDIWFLTHPDSDHVNGFMQTVSEGGIKVKMLAVPYKLKEEFREITTQASDMGIKICYLDCTDVITGRKNEYIFRVLSPDSAESYPGENEASLVLYFREDDFTVLFMGDGGIQAEEAAENYPGEEGITVLKCAHHGSAVNANTTDFYEALRPECSVVSCGKNNRYGHPHAETVNNIHAVSSKLFRTDEGGAVLFEKKGHKRYRVRSFCR